MTKNLKAVKSAMIAGIILFSMITVFSSSVMADDDYTSLLQKEDGSLVSFNQYIELEFDKTELNTPLTIDQPVTVPITIDYSHDVPEEFLQVLRLASPLIYNRIIFGSMMAPQQQIKLSITEKPDWADIYIDNPTVILNIPSPGDTNYPHAIKKVNLVIIPFREAPAQPKSISIVAECEGVGSLLKISQENTLSFTPVYIPRIDVSVEDPVREVAPRETINFKVHITNNANKQTIVKLDYTAPAEWAPVISPSEVYIAPKASATVTFSVKAPHSFGWHDNTVSMRIECQPYPDPMPSENLSDYEISKVVQDVQITNYGFSLAGAELVLLVLIIIIVVIVIFIFYLKKERNKSGN